MSTVALIDYGAGNLRSVSKALAASGAKVCRVSHGDDFGQPDRVVLPGVGSFQDAMAQLGRRHLLGPIKAHIAADRPFLGICVGLQLLFEWGDEGGARVEGLGAFAGHVTRLPARPDLNVPHMGWNTIQIERPAVLLEGIPNGSYAYFLHSYIVVPSDPDEVLTRTPYGEPFCSAVTRSRVHGTQFHPEKSQRLGLQVLANFLRS